MPPSRGRAYCWMRGGGGGGLILCLSFGAHGPNCWLSGTSANARRAFTREVRQLAMSGKGQTPHCGPKRRRPGLRAKDLKSEPSRSHGDVRYVGPTKETETDRVCSVLRGDRAMSALAHASRRTPRPSSTHGPASRLIIRPPRLSVAREAATHALPRRELGDRAPTARNLRIDRRGRKIRRVPDGKRRPWCSTACRCPPDGDPRRPGRRRRRPARSGCPEAPLTPRRKRRPRRGRK